MEKKHFTYISLFSSAGVGCYGFKQQGFKCIATNELLEKRLSIQKLNQVCQFSTGYILGDIKSPETKGLIFKEISRWQSEGNGKVDVIIATPPCQGMSVANHKKRKDEIARNSLVVESVELIKKVSPKFFIMENVASFWKTGCTYKDNVVPIGEMIQSELNDQFEICHDVINLKNYGCNSSRTRTLVIGVNRLFESISPKELFPKYRQEKVLVDVIGHLPSLEWGEYDQNDFYHSFRIYPSHMREWIIDLKEGESAFDNKEDHKKPHQIKDGVLVVNKSKNGDKYKRQVYDKVGPCIHTRNDQLASQNTIHPIDDRVFSIRELMLMMSIPETFKWLDIDIENLNSMTYKEKRKLSRKTEMNIRQSIGEAIPTKVVSEIAANIKEKIKGLKCD